MLLPCKPLRKECLKNTKNSMLTRQIGKNIMWFMITKYKNFPVNCLSSVQ